MTQAISKLTIKGYKSIRSLENFELRNLNILIGANGGGKSSFLSFFEFLQAIAKEKGLPNFYVERKGGAYRFLYLGPIVTRSIKIELIMNSLPPYTKELYVTINDKFTASTYISTVGWDHADVEIQDIEKHFSSYVVYHFQDTSDFARLKLPTSEGNYDYLFTDASNLAPFLFRMKEKQPRDYQAIIEVVRLAAPFFDDFSFNINEQRGEIKWWWLQKGSDYKFHPSQISDGTLRFICLATALLQPNPPSTILLDEPELGLHPYALGLFAGLIQKASIKTQVIVATQSAGLIDHFQPEDIILVERKNDESIFSRPDTEKLKIWLEDYSLGDIWSRNILEGTAGQ
ncbi:MAG TPA: AAA family ATPase [Sedimentisphaerales bacterium]|nr:AAA family ATPase [Sedimentisphaerales bacterium]